jgi:hypothetical protein
MGLEPGPEVTRAFGFYALLLENHILRLKGATRDAQLGDYGAQRLVNDAVSFWTDTVSAAFFPLTLVAPVKVEVIPPTALMQFRVANEDALTAGHRVAYPGEVTLVSDTLGDTNPGPGSASIPANNVELTLLEEGRFLVVRLHGLTTLNPPLAQGRSYEGAVHPQGKNTPVVARIHVDKL